MAAAVDQSTDKRWHDRYPELGTGPIPLEPYISREYFEKERDLIFRKLWLNVGRVEQLPEAGTYFVKDLAVCGTSVVVARAEDGTLGAFQNMCSHRGNQLVWDAKGTCKTFSCKFHGWVYGLDGSLRHIVDEGKFFDVDKAKLGLTHVSVDTWEGFVFINLDPHPSQSLDEYLGEDLRESVKGYPFADESVDCVSWHTDVNANWKAVKDAFQEVYHIPTLHRRTIGNVFASKENPHANALDFTLFGPHGRISLAANPDRPVTRVEEAAQKYGSMVIQQNVEADVLPAGVNPTRYPNWSFDGLMLFPNTLVYVSQGTYLTHIFWPLSEKRTRWEIRNYAPKAKTMAGRFSQEYGKVSFRDTLLEDGSTLEKTQAMLASGAKQEIVLQDEELFIRHHHHVTEGLLNAKDGA
jgi:phenylpropionate dioxygenase-like ring-hydroxylating dioxygenase large terminal subunit